jgi:hypothetical protein
LPLRPRRISAAPIAVRQRLRAPEVRARRWSGSTVDWYLTLRVEVEGGMTVGRRYPIDLVRPPAPSECLARSAGWSPPPRLPR